MNEVDLDVASEIVDLMDEASLGTADETLDISDEEIEL